MNTNKPFDLKSKWLPGRSWPVFALQTLVLLWAVHADVFFAHEFAHSFLAWALGWKANPLALYYGGLTAGNLLAQSQIDENVDYTPIFAGGHGVEAGLIAAAGVVAGNGLITYAISRWGYAAAKLRGSRSWAMVFYWMFVASVGNFLCYVPVRTFSFREDMYTVCQGFNCSPWWIIVVLGIPFAVAIVHFFIKFGPGALGWLFPESRARRYILIFLTAFAVFGFYGASGWSDSGRVSHVLSEISVFGLIPLAVLLGWWWDWRR